MENIFFWQEWQSRLMEQPGQPLEAPGRNCSVPDVQGATVLPEAMGRKKLALEVFSH